MPRPRHAQHQKSRQQEVNKAALPKWRVRLLLLRIRKETVIVFELRRPPPVRVGFGLGGMDAFAVARLKKR